MTGHTMPETWKNFNFPDNNFKRFKFFTTFVSLKAVAIPYSGVIYYFLQSLSNIFINDLMTSNKGDENEEKKYG